MADITYRPGMKITCPSCGQVSLVKLVAKMDGWTKVGDVLSCAICKAELGAAATPAGACPAQGSPGDRKREESLKRFSSFLAEDRPDRPVASESLGVTAEIVRFCKDCVHFYRHPFVDKCLLHQRPTGPMDDCDEFQRRPAAEAAEERGED